MRTRDNWSRKAFVAVLMIGAFGVFGCRPSTKTAEADKSQPSTTEAEATTAETTVEEIAIPEGTAGASSWFCALRTSTVNDVPGGVVLPNDKAFHRRNGSGEITSETNSPWSAYSSER